MPYNITPFKNVNFLLILLLFYSISYWGDPSVFKSQYFNDDIRKIKYLPFIFLLLYYFIYIITNIKKTYIILLFYIFFIFISFIFSKNLYFLLAALSSIICCLALSTLFIKPCIDKYLILKFLFIYIFTILISQENSIGINNIFGDYKLSLGYYYPKDNASIISFATLILLYFSNVPKNIVWIFSFLIVFFIGNYTNLFVHIFLFMLFKKIDFKIIAYLSIIIIIFYYLFIGIIILIDECTLEYTFHYLPKDFNLQSLSERFYRTCSNIFQFNDYRNLDNSITEIFNTGTFNIIILILVLIFIEYTYKFTLPIILLIFLFQSGLFIIGNLSFITILLMIFIRNINRTEKVRKALFI